MMLQKIKRTIQRYQTEKTIKSLMNKGDKLSSAVGLAIQKTHKNLLTSSELSVIDQILALRKKLHEENATVQFIDYGAGNPDDPLNFEDSQQGKLQERTVQMILDKGNLHSKYCLLLFHLIRAFNSSRVLELGTSLGISAAYMGKGIQLNNPEGLLITLEGGEALAQMARENFEVLDLSKIISVHQGPFHKTLDDALKQVQVIDFAFIDGHHDGHATLEYFEKVLKSCANTAVIVFDDIKWYASMREAWAKIINSPQVCLSLDCDVVGICVISPSQETKNHYKLVL